jgi:hypothetical protein
MDRNSDRRFSSETTPNINAHQSSPAWTKKAPGVPDYSEAIALRKEDWINGCRSGKQISRMLRNLH